MTTARLDETIHAPNRLAVVALLAPCGWVEFGVARDHIGVSDSVMSKLVSALEAANYVKVKKGYVGKRPRTWLALTRSGRVALQNHVAALQAIVAQATAAAPAATTAPGG